jgi:uncharacterized protein with HEPN domain
MTRRDPSVRLLHMRDFAHKAIDMAAGRTRSELESNDMLRLALTHLVELVGEAASQVPKEVQQKYPQIPWPKVISMRHRLIHGYDLVDCDILWDTIVHDLPGLVGVLEENLGREPQ